MDRCHYPPHNYRRELKFLEMPGKSGSPSREARGSQRGPELWGRVSAYEDPWAMTEAVTSQASDMEDSFQGLAHGVKPGLWLSWMFSRFLTCHVVSVERPFCSHLWGDSDPGAGAGCGQSRACVSRSRGAPLCSHGTCLLTGLFLSPPSQRVSFILSWIPVQCGKACFSDVLAEHGQRTLLAGAFLTFCTIAQLPIRAFLSKNANRPEIDCISKCNREAKCIFSKYG